MSNLLAVSKSCMINTPHIESLELITESMEIHITMSSGRVHVVSRKTPEDLKAAWQTIGKAMGQDV